MIAFKIAVFVISLNVTLLVLLSLNFQELEPIYDTDYKFTGGQGERADRDDTDEGYRWKIKTDEVGY